MIKKKKKKKPGTVSCTRLQQLHEQVINYV